MLCLLALGAASVLVQPAARWARCAPPPRGLATQMVLDQMKSALQEIKGQTAAVIVQQKVADKLARAREKYTIPDKYVDVMGGFFTSYMTEIYKAGLDMDKYEATLTTLFSKVGARSLGAV